MLFLITGTPGAGKSQYWVSLLFGALAPENREISISGVVKSRDVFESGVTGLDHEQFDVKPLPDAEKWYECPTGSAIVIDEAQRIFPQRMAGREVPQKCREFETHRHKGFDVWLITQDATLLDAHVRKLVNYHIHVDRLFGLPVAKVYTYPKYVEKPSDAWTKKQEATSRKWFFYRRKFYRAYKSSEVHTVKKKVPLLIYAFPLLIAFIIWSGNRFWKGLNESDTVDVAESVAVAGVDPFGVPGGAPSLAGLPTAERKAAARAEWMHQVTPVIDGYPWTAPIYDKLRQDVKSFPRPFCVLVEYPDPNYECHCISQQGTKLFVTNPACVNIALNGLFDPTVEDSEGARAGRGALAAPDGRAPGGGGEDGVKHPSYFVREAGITVMEPANKVPDIVLPALE